MTIGNYREEFRDFDGELPIIEGFKDSSWHNETCPSLLNEELHLQLFVDYVDPQKSEFPEERLAGAGRYLLRRLDDENQVLPPGTDIVIDTDDFDEVLAKIAEFKASPGSSF